MCGIILACNLSKDSLTVNDWCLNRYEDQIHRGQKGFGIVGLKEDGTIKVERATEPYKFMWDIHNLQSRFLMVHHRIPTNSDNLISQTHPIFVNNKDLLFKYLVMHNGVIVNDGELYKAHTDEGFDYTTYRKVIYTKTKNFEFNDSECLAIELAKVIDGLSKNKKNLKLATEGNAAFIVLQLSHDMKPLNIFWGRNSGNPLKIGQSQDKLRLASEGPGEDVKINTLFCQDLTKEKIKIKEIPLIIPEKKIVYSTPAPAITYNLKSETEKTLIKSKKPVNIEDDDEDYKGYSIYRPEKTDQDEILYLEAGEIAERGETIEMLGVDPIETDLLEQMDGVVDDAQVLCERIVNEFITNLTDSNEIWTTDSKKTGERLTKILESARNQIIELSMNLPAYDIPNERANTKITTTV